MKLQASGLRPLKKTLWQKCFPVSFAKFLRTPFFIKHRFYINIWILKLEVCHLYNRLEDKYFLSKVNFLATLTIYELEWDNKIELNLSIPNIETSLLFFFFFWFFCYFFFFFCVVLFFLLFLSFFLSFIFLFPGCFLSVIKV